jgi:glycyl-tRNA synthetase beta chain
MDFLLEIGTEEIPARMIDGAREELARRVRLLLEREALIGRNEDPSTVEAYSTPRRLAVLVRDVSDKQADDTSKVLGPAVKVAFKDGQPTAAAQAFARKVGVDVGSLEQEDTPKGKYLVAQVQKKGRTASDILAEALPKEIAGIYWAKNMYWRGKSAERFVRPLRWLVTLLDGEVVPLEFAGIRAGDVSQGHRILSSGPLTIKRPADYATTLATGSVIVTSAEREHRIRKTLDAATRTIPGARWREDKSLLDTVVNLTEFPSAVLGSFDPEFLALADEVLVTVMRDHQKYFALEDANGKLLPHFLAVLNTDGDPDGLIRHGNERVLRARFNDARFFWETDQKIPLRDRVAMLKSVTFQKDLGSYYDKTRRVQKLGSLICETIRSAGGAIRPGIVFKSAHLCKADLTTELVKEFTELQGIIGGLYAKAQELDPILPRATVEAIGDAIYDHYKPESMDDSVPRTAEGGVVAIADKADTLAGLVGIGLIPSGSKDPFALRRAANGIVRIIAEHKLPLPFHKLFADARAQYRGSPAEKGFTNDTDYATATFSLMRERCEFYLRDVLGYPYDVVNAVLIASYDRGDDFITDLIARCEAGRQLKRLPEFAPLFAAFKRIKNIVRQAREKGIDVGQVKLEFRSEFESNLWDRIQQIAVPYVAFRREQNYVEAFRELLKLRDDIDRYFDNVMVMVDDNEVRAARLGLLHYLVESFTTILDISEIIQEHELPRVP